MAIIIGAYTAVSLVRTQQVSLHYNHLTSRREADDHATYIASISSAHRAIIIGAYTASILAL
jgi:hypothetical protein